MNGAVMLRSAVLFIAVAMIANLPVRAQPANDLLALEVSKATIEDLYETLSDLQSDLETLWEIDRAQACATALPDYLRRMESLLAEYQKSERLAQRLGLEGTRADAAEKAQEVAGALAEAREKLPALCGTAAR
jgi:peptidoglycan hydrolase CwlO-like protein